ncbi:MAG: mechanosensitive ion channel family protein [Planctomycetes bacterium]|nr:mechanosensitive ion channel family protein [Planctomycetota bacterium]
MFIARLSIWLLALATALLGFFAFKTHALERPIGGAELWKYLATMGGVFIALSTTRVVGRILSALQKRDQANDYKRILWKSAAGPVAAVITVLGIYASSHHLIHALWTEALGNIRKGVFAVAAGAIFWFLYRAVELFDLIARRIAMREDNSLDAGIIDIGRKTLRVFLVIVAVIFIGQTILDLNITALVAGAGVAGLAVAFAAQDSIANVFGTVMLLIDKPFKVGDRVVVNDADGAVEEIGFRSTRIRTLEGHLVSIPNKEVANIKIQNIGRRPHIRRLTNLTITYDTPLHKVERALEIVRAILKDHEGFHPDFPPRVFFNDFNDCSLNILVIAWYHPPDYWSYLTWCERTNLEIMRQFESEGIEFAFPTTTTYLAHDPKRFLGLKAEALGVNAATPPTPGHMP